MYINLSAEQKAALRRIVRQQEYKKSSESIKEKYKDEPDFYDRVTDEVLPNLLESGCCDLFVLEQGSYRHVVLYDKENKEKFIIDYNGNYEQSIKYEPKNTSPYDIVLLICVFLFFLFLVLWIIVGFIIDSTPLTGFIIVLGIINLIVGFVVFLKRPMV